MKLSLCFALFGLVALATAGKVRYDNYKVYRITPKDEGERSFLLELQANNPGVVFWKQVRNVGQPVDIMFPPHLLHILDGFQSRNLSFSEMVNDVQSLINVEAMAVPGPRLTWDAYYPVSEIYAFLEEMATTHPTIARVVTYGMSYESRELKYIVLNKGNTPKPVIFIDANIHSREWITNTIATWTIKELLEGASTYWLDTYNFYIVPVVNPDGYEYSRNTDRMWRKTRSNLAGGLCRGADPNRNFPFGWNTGGSSNQPCSDTFMGVSAASEPEVKALHDLLGGLEEDMIFYLSLHSYSQLILIPYGTDLGRVPDHDWHMEVGQATRTAIRTKYGTDFTPGNIVELLYVASGASVDYVKGSLDPNVEKLTYTFEMRDTGRYGFILPPEQIIPSCEEFMDGLRVMLEMVQKKVQSH
jgi:hypothetical protein